MSQSRNWVFTINNPTEDENPQCWEGYKFLVYQLEEGEEGTPHYQGYVCFTSNQRISALKRKYSGRAHWEVRQGTHTEAYEYCTKEDTRIEGPWEYGDPPENQGQRTDLETLREMIEEGASDRELAVANFGSWVRYNRSFSQYRLICKPPRDYKTVVTVIFGPTGTGKSRHLAENYPNAYWKPNSRWWDGYNGQEHVVVDEFYGWLPYDFMLRLCDRYPLQVETKGGTIAFTSKFIHFTSNQRPELWYKHNFAPLERRIEYVYEKDTLDSPMDELKGDNVSHYIYNL